MKTENLFPLSSLRLPSLFLSRPFYLRSNLLGEFFHFCGIVFEELIQYMGKNFQNSEVVLFANCFSVGPQVSNLFQSITKFCELFLLLCPKI